MESPLSQNKQSIEVSDEELLKVIADFLEMGHVENIVAMFKQESRYFDRVGKLLEDQRFSVRLGVSVLFEYLIEETPDKLHLALPSLEKALQHTTSWVRGEAVSVLALIGSADAMALVKILENDPAHEVADLVREILREGTV
jgi:HEAT repeat protein